MKMIKLKLSYFTDVIDEDNGPGAINNSRESMLLTSAELDYKKSTIVKDDDKPVKTKRKEKGERPKRNCFNTALASDQTLRIPDNAQAYETVLMLDLVYVRHIVVDNAWQLHKNIFWC